MTTTETTATAIAPVTAGAPAKKAATKKAATKKAATKKAATKKAAAPAGNGVVAGKAEAMMKALKKGVTVEDLAKELEWSEATAKTQLYRLKRANGLEFEITDGKYRIAK